jgi:hypothetical protein
VKGKVQSSYISNGSVVSEKKYKKAMDNEDDEGCKNKF